MDMFAHGSFPSNTQPVQQLESKAPTVMFSMELAPWNYIPYQPTKSTNINATQSTLYEISHGPLDVKRAKHNSGKPMIPSSMESNTLTITTAQTATTQQILPITTNATATTKDVQVSSPEIEAYAIRTQLPQGANSHVNSTNNLPNKASTSHTPLRNIKHVTKTSNSKYIVISMFDTIPKDTSIRRGRKCSIHHRRNDKLSTMIDFILTNKDIDMFDSAGSNWTNTMHSNKLNKSHRDLLNCLDKGKVFESKKVVYMSIITTIVLIFIRLRFAKKR